jgi:Pre-mRNA splicing factor PRP21 like protein.
MLDPRYKDIKAEVTARAQNVTMASGDDIAQNLQAFARRRPDLFGDSEDRPAPEPKPSKFVL